VPQAARDATILDIEEDRDLHRYRARLLEHFGLVVEGLDGAAAARERRLREPRPDLVILCRHQPEAGRAIREAEREFGLPRVPILVVGGISVERLLTYARDADADAVVCHDPLRMMPFVEAVLGTGWPDASGRASAAVRVGATTSDRLVRDRDRYRFEPA
jgi:DNA-binding response OmpR family regulator